MNLLIQQAVFTDFRPIFYVMLGILIVFLILSFIPGAENRGIPFGSVMTVSIIQILLGVIMFFTESNIVDTYSLTADKITLYLFIGILALAIVNPIVYKIRNRSSSGSRYRYRRF